MPLRKLRMIAALVMVSSILFTPFRASAQLIPLSSITGGSSVFVFRTVAKTTRRPSTARPSRTKSQRIETVARIKKQYQTIARTSPRVNRAQALDPEKLPKNIRLLPAAEGSKLFAGVGEFYNDKGEYDKAIEFFSDAVTLDESNITAKTGFSEALAIKGNDLLLKDQAGAAKSVFLEALQYDPKNAAAYFGLGEVYAELNKTAEAIESYENSLANNKDLTEIYVPLGILYYQDGQIAKADELLTKALAFSAESAETQFFLGLVRASQNNTDEALAAFQKAKTLDPTLAEAFFNSGEMLDRLERTADAVPDYQKATELKPNYFEAWLALAEAQFELGKYEEAIVAYNGAKRLQNNNWQVFAGLGESYRRSGNFELAEANYNNATLFIANAPDYNKDTAADLYSKMGLSVGQQCDINIQKNIKCNWPVAINALKKAAELSGNPIDQVNLGWAYFRAGHQAAERRDTEAARPNLEFAVSTLQTAAASGPPAEDFALQNLAAAQIDLADYKNAIETLNKFLAKKPEMHFAKYALGVAYNKSGDLPNAEKWLRAATDADPNNLGYLVGLADTLISAKKGKELQKIIDRIRPLDAAVAANLEQRKRLLRL